jgi:hypothetical protein
LITDGALENLEQVRRMQAPVDGIQP